MTRAATPKLGGYAALAALGLFCGLALGRVELVVLAAPFALVLATGLVSAPDLRPLLSFRLGTERALEGDEVSAELAIRSERTIDRLDLVLALPVGIEPAGEGAFSIRVRKDEDRRIDVPLLCRRWGAYGIGRVALAAHDPFGLFLFEDEQDRRVPLKVFPRAAQLRRIVRPRETQPHVGNLVARQKAEGIEFADLRPYVPGDRVRRVNWRATARRGSLIVNEQHPERSSAVVLLLDSFGEARLGAEGTLDQAVRAAATLAADYLRRRDQVGLVSFGGSVSWLEPSTGLVQLYRIVDALLGTEIFLSYVWRDIGRVPVHALPPQALVLALTPLLDERMVEALGDLRGRGFDLAVVEVSPEPFLEAARGAAQELAFRIWRLRRAAMRSRFRRLGVPVVEWRAGDELDRIVEEVTSFRRFARTVRI